MKIPPATDAASARRYLDRMLAAVIASLRTNPDAAAAWRAGLSYPIVIVGEVLIKFRDGPLPDEVWETFPPVSLADLRGQALELVAGLSDQWLEEFVAGRHGVSVQPWGLGVA